MCIRSIYRSTRQKLFELAHPFPWKSRNFDLVSKEYEHATVAKEKRSLKASSDHRNYYINGSCVWDVLGWLVTALLADWSSLRCTSRRIVRRGYYGVVTVVVKASKLVLKQLLLVSYV